MNKDDDNSNERIWRIVGIVAIIISIILLIIIGYLAYKLYTKPVSPKCVISEQDIINAKTANAMLDAYQEQVDLVEDANTCGKVCKLRAQDTCGNNTANRFLRGIRQDNQTKVSNSGIPVAPDAGKVDIGNMTESEAREAMGF